MGLPRGVHMQAHMLNGVGDVGPGEDEVLRYWSAGLASIGRHVGDQGMSS
jgi:hypothetical protein